jgi:hypothetical protein
LETLKWLHLIEIEEKTRTMLSLCNFPWLQEENHKGNHRPLWAWNLAFPNQRGLSHCILGSVARSEMEISFKMWWMAEVKNNPLGMESILR